MKIRSALSTTMLALVIANSANFAAASNSYANECDDVAAELDKIEAECDRIVDDMAAQRDEAVRRAAAEAAVRATIAAQLEEVTAELSAERELRIRAEVTRPRRWVWFAAGGGTAVAVITVAALLLR